MSYDVTSLLMHSDDVPLAVKAAITASRSAGPSEREAHLRSAARELVRSVDLDCSEARELVGLPQGSC